MGRRIYFTDEELRQVLAACQDYAFLGDSGEHDASREIAWGLLRKAGGNSSDPETRAAFDRSDRYRQRLEQRILSKLHGTSSEYQPGADSAEQDPASWPTGASVDFVPARLVAAR